MHVFDACLLCCGDRLYYTVYGLYDVPGSAVVCSSESFAMIRGGHTDFTIRLVLLKLVQLEKLQVGLHERYWRSNGPCRSP